MNNAQKHTLQVFDWLPAGENICFLSIFVLQNRIWVKKNTIRPAELRFWNDQMGVKSMHELNMSYNSFPDWVHSGLLDWLTCKITIKLSLAKLFRRIPIFRAQTGTKKILDRINKFLITANDMRHFNWVWHQLFYMLYIFVKTLFSYLLNLCFVPYHSMLRS